MEVPMQDAGLGTLFPPSPEEISAAKERLSTLLGEYIRIEDDKKASDADFNERLTDLWDEIRELRARIREGEE